MSSIRAIWEEPEKQQKQLTDIIIFRYIMKKIFDPFFTTNKQGFGVGLTVVKQIIKAHNGTIDVKSEPNMGTTFSISLPISEMGKEARGQGG